VFIKAVSALIKSRCKADVFEIVEEGKDFTPEPIIWEF